MKKTMAILLFVFCLQNGFAFADEKEIQELRKQVEELTERVKRLESAVAPITGKALAEERVEKQRTKARERMSKDAEAYSRSQLREIEGLYQVANQKWQTDEGKNSLKDLIKKYDKANRTGCAMLYLGQMSEGVEKEEYLRKAIADFSDCWYGDGVQVGPLARFILAQHYRDTKQPEKADELLKETKRLYTDAIDHSGKPLFEQ